ncbi:helix-turn-helix domain-containing protein [Streptomyces sp. NPDC018019]|uniref:helix-turn-helix domain-containing protein n=1 Tax=Streptomyces sp. NPDC018019 TaxID=3365030 RepID=UPI0037B4BB54
MDTRGNTGPAGARDVTEFLAMLRELKERRGLTYRQLEQRAAEQGEVLARSTLADILGGRRLPRPEVLAVFVRACGEGERLAAWLDAREHVAAQARKPSQPAAEPATEPTTAGQSDAERVMDVERVTDAKPVTDAAVTAPAHPRRRLLPSRAHRTPLLLAAVAAVAVAAGATAWALTPGKAPQSASGGTFGAQAGAREAAAPTGWIRIRPAVAPALCVTDGPVQDKRYGALVAVQRPCGDVAPQRTTLEPVGPNTYRIAWVHPDHGKGCLKALSGGAADGLLEPWDACGKASSFRVEREPSSAGAKSGRYVFRADGEQCLGVRDSGTATGVEIMLQPCTGSTAQQFLIDRAR